MSLSFFLNKIIYVWWSPQLRDHQAPVFTYFFPIRSCVLTVSSTSAKNGLYIMQLLFIEAKYINSSEQKEAYTLTTCGSCKTVKNIIG